MRLDPDAEWRADAMRAVNEAYRAWCLATLIEDVGLARHWWAMARGIVDRCGVEPTEWETPWKRRQFFAFSVASGRIEGGAA